MIANCSLSRTHVSRKFLKLCTGLAWGSATHPALKMVSPWNLRVRKPFSLARVEVKLVSHSNSHNPRVIMYASCGLSWIKRLYSQSLMPVSLHSRGLLQCVFMGLPLKIILEVSASVIMSVLRFTHKYYYCCQLRCWLSHLNLKWFRAGIPLRLPSLNWIRLFSARWECGLLDSSIREGMPSSGSPGSSVFSNDPPSWE